MGQAINTTVNGSSGTCVEAAEYTNHVAKSGDTCGDGIQRATNTTYAGWDGPAANAFLSSLSGTRPQVDGVAEVAMAYSRALHDFAAALDGVVNRVNDAIGKAQAGGLRMDGPFILQPEPFTTPKPGTPKGFCTAEQGSVVVGQYQGDVAAWNAALAEHNRKVAVFNECKAIVHAARNAEEEAHHHLQDAFTRNQVTDLDSAKLGTTTASQAVGYIAAMDNPRSNALNMARRSETAAQFFEGWAKGTRINMTADDRTLLAWAASEANGNSTAYQKRATEFAKYVDKVPEPLRKFVAAYPGKKYFEKLPDEAAGKLKGTRSILRGMPYVGSTLTLATEAVGAVEGQQSWTKAAVDSGLVIGGAALGAAAASAGAAALYGSALGPVGAFLAGTAGGVAGMIWGQEVADLLVPD